MAGASDTLIRFVGAAVVYLLGALAAYGQDLYGCVRPIGTPPVPDGSIATLADMEATRDAVEAFLSEGEAYLSCLANVPDDPTIAAIRDQVSVQMDLVVNRFNDALCAYSRGTQCVQTAMEDRSAAELTAGESTASISDIRASGPHDSDERLDEYERDDVAVSAVFGLENSGDAVLLESAQASIQGPMVPGAGAQRKAPSINEPTLPDGTPCGSVTQLRNDVSGDGVNLRGDYIWDVYNACFEPIRMRWTFAGDGLLNAGSSIPARGAQRLGCSTRGDVVSRRSCTGGIEYVFEWP